MPYLNDLNGDYIAQLIANQNQYMPPAGAQIRLPQGAGGAYASYPMPWETQTPQYTYPNPLTMIRSGYKTNEFAYSIIMTRAKAKASAPLYAYDNAEEHAEELPKHEMTMFFNKVNQLMSQGKFWQIKQIYQDIAGFAAFEIEQDNSGRPIRLWPMLPHWCSFLRGAPVLPDGTPNPYSRIRAIRYMPYGLQPMDIPMERILFFSNPESFDPEYNDIRFYSPLMHAFPQVEVDSALTLFLNDFVKHGAKFSGLISVQQTINDTVAKDIQRRFTEYHGGANNWSQPLVLGQGAAYTPTQMTFADMAFPELDARLESRICAAFTIDPIVAGANAGLASATFNNKAEADINWYHSWVVPSWQDDAETVHDQLLPFFEDDMDRFTCAFNTKDVWGLNEDMDKKSTRIVAQAQLGIICRDEAREALGYDPVDEVEVWLNVQSAAEGLAMSGDIEGAAELEKETAEAAADAMKPKAEGEKEKEETEADKEAATSEEKKFRKYARARVKEGKQDIISEWEFKFVPLARQAELFAEFGIIRAVAEKDAPADAVALYGELKRTAQAFETTTGLAREDVEGYLKRMEAKMEPQITVNVPPAQVTVNVPPAQIHVSVPPPEVKIENKINVPEPKPRPRRKAKIVTDSNGTVTGIEEQ